MVILGVCILSLITLLALAARVLFNKKKAKAVTNRKIIAPEPPGAWPFIGHLHVLDGSLPIARKLGAMADEHGPIFSLRLATSRAVVVSNWETIKECYTTNDKIFANRPNMAFAKYVAYNSKAFPFAAYGPYWRDVRKMVIQELFTNQQLVKFKNVRASELDFFIKDLYLMSSKGIVIDLSKWFEHLTLNLILRILVGQRFSSCCDDETKDGDWKVKEAVKKALYLSGIFIVSDAIPWLEWMDIGGHIKAIMQSGKELDMVLQHWLEEHVEKRNKCGAECEDVDFMDVMLSSFPEDAVMDGRSRADIIKSTTVALILTGSESTAETLIWAVSLLLNNPHILAIIKDELDVHVGKNRWVEESDIPNLKHLEAAVEETLRLYPPGPLSGPREASEDCWLGDYFVPKGTRLIVNVWKLQRDPRVWDDPLMFKPERFLDKNANVSYKGQNHAYIPFSSGRRMCPAVTYAMQVVQLSLARLVQGFDIATPNGEPVDMTEGLGISLPKVEPLQVVLTPRLPLEFYLSMN